MAVHDTPAGVVSTLQQVEYQHFPEEFFSGADVVVYFGDIWLADITSLQFTLIEQVRPIYGYASYTFDKVKRGSRIVQGRFSIAFREAGYLYNVLEHIGQLGGNSNAPALSDMLSDQPVPDWHKDALQTIEDALNSSTKPAPRPSPSSSSSSSVPTVVQPSKTVLLKRGSRGEDVKKLQAALNQLGFNCGAVDGIFGPKTESAVKAFQRAYGLAVDGIVGPQTWGKINELLGTKTVSTISSTGPLLKRGSRGEDVKRLQTALNRLGFNCGAVDGIFGSRTEAAVKAFQRQYGLKVDGIVGPQTWGKLSELLNRASMSGRGVMHIQATLLKLGSRGEDVKRLQNALNRLGFSCGAADGIFGPKTQAAVKAFQKKYGLKVDGIVGPQTWGKINKLLGSTSTPLLKLGSRGEDVKRLQNALNRLGFSCGAADGIFGPKTQAAVKAFQRRYGLAVDGIVGPKTWGKINELLSSSAPAGQSTQMPLLKRGSRGEDVRRLQEALKRLGFDPGPIDGIFGPKTEAAVKAFQKKYGLVVDGIVGPKTWAKINELLNSRSSSSTGSGTTGGTSGSPGAHKAMSDYENEIWGDPFVPERAQSRHYKPFFYSGEYSKALQETGFDIYIVYGPLPYDVEKRGNTLPGMVSYNTTVKAIRGVQLTGCTQILDPTGKPIEEVYEFIARDID